MKVMISKKEIQANNAAFEEILTNLDMVSAKEKRVFKDAIARLDSDFKGAIEDLQKKSVEEGNARKVSFRYCNNPENEESFVMELHQDYYIRYMQLVTKYTKPYANIINSVVGMLMSFKAAFENFGFIAKGFEEEAKKLEAEFSTKKD